jgi:hypothetical protein
MAKILGWAINLIGLALWLYGYFWSGRPPLIDWRSTAPWWIADFLPNIEAEAGMVLMIASMFLIYWPTKKT